jgi:activator of 2-hydroxyglutaryl-CoA dehydratase
LQDCWRYRIPETWDERGYHYDKNTPINELIQVPKNAEYYAAYGAVLFGMRDRGVDEGKPEQDATDNTAQLETFIKTGRKSALGETAGPALAKNDHETHDFIKQYQVDRFVPMPFKSQQVVRGVIGLDGGSTSSKLVLIDEQHEVIKKVYCLSKGNPIADMKDMMAELKQWVIQSQIQLKLLGFGVTGYAGDILEKALSADCNIVETVAHMKSATHYFPDADVICDIGGQDIKVLFLRNQDINNFRLSNACSAGNGMLLQAMADQFGIPVTEYADTAFKADLSPTFSYGCAVFLDSDRVNFQKEGYTSEELLAGLALVLPKNVWQYVVQIPRMSELGKVFVLQGGTQNNLAAVKAQVDYIKARVPDAQVHVHPHTGEAGAIGAAYEALRVVSRQGYSTFVGLDNAINIKYSATTDENTRCDFCANNCSRTFIDTHIPGSNDTARYISGFSCEKGTVEDYDALRELNKQRRVRMKRFPNMVDLEAKLCFKAIKKPKPLPDSHTLINDIRVKKGWFGKITHIPFQRPFDRSGHVAHQQRSTLRIGIPRVLNMWSTGPFWRTYFETLGIHRHNLIFQMRRQKNYGRRVANTDPLILAFLPKWCKRIFIIYYLNITPIKHST